MTVLVNRPCINTEKQVRKQCSNLSKAERRGGGGGRGGGPRRLLFRGGDIFGVNNLEEGKRKPTCLCSDGF